MKKTKKGFTLVELIVVIVILAILSTIGFTTLSSYNDDSRNAKVTSDLRNLASAIEVVRSRNSITLNSIVQNTNTNNTVALSSVVNNSWSTLWTPWVSYLVWNIDFIQINQNWAEFKDPNSFDRKQEYVYAAANNWDFSFYQIAGTIIKNDVAMARINGTYAKFDPANDTNGLISTFANTIPVVDSEPLIGDLYQ